MVVVVAYGKIIPKRFLNLPKFGFINIHASLLPKWRGAAPMQRSIMNLDRETGITIMKIVEELDAGPIIHQDKIKISENVDTKSLSKLLSQLGAKSLIKAMNKIFNVGPASVPGGYESVNNISFLLNDTIQYEVEHGPAMRIIIDFDDVENALSVIPSGQSGHAFSPHYNDQFELYNSGKFRKMHMNFDNTSKESIATMQLNP